jgi:hypothetical protein
MPKGRILVPATQRRALGAIWVILFMPNPTYYLDYDSDHGLKLNSIEEKIDYLEGRIKRIFINPIEWFFCIRKTDSTIWELNMGICILICEGITGLSTYLCKAEDEELFKCFIEEYMYPNDSQKKNHATVLWRHVRCQLSHGFHIHRAKIETDSKMHFVIDTKGRLVCPFGKPARAGTRRIGTDRE